MRLLAGDEAIVLRQMFFCRSFQIQRLRQFNQRASGHRQRLFAVAKIEPAPRRDPRQFLRRGSVACRPDHKRRLHLRQQFEIGFSAKTHINHRIRQRRFANPQLIIWHVRHAIRRNTERQQQLNRQPLQRHNPAGIDSGSLRRIHLPQQRRERHRR